MASNLVGLKLRVCMLGSFYLEVNGKGVPATAWKSKKALNLFRYLVARRGEKVPKDKLIELLWPETEFDVSMEQNLHTCVYFARRVIEPDLQPYGRSEFIAYSNGLYWLEQCEACWVDIEEFEHLYEEGKRHQKQEPSQATSAFKQALSLYRGDFLAEDPYLDWSADAREYYREIYVDATLRLSTLLAMDNDVPEAVRACRSALRKDPYREDLHHAVIAHLLDAGRYSEAATQYRLYARMMKDEFGLEPSREARALLLKIQQSGQSMAAATSQDDVAMSGAFSCDRKLFESICHLERRRQERSQQPVTFMLVSLTKSRRQEYDGRYLSMIASSLRRGGVVSQWEDDKIAICLWGTEEAGARVVSRRIKSDVEKDGKTRVTISYDVLKADDGLLTQETMQEGN